MLKGKRISITFVGLTPAPVVVSLLSDQTHIERPASSSQTDQGCIFSAVTQDTNFNSSCVVYAFSLPIQRATQSCPNTWVLVRGAESSVFAGFISHCKGLC